MASTIKVDKIEGSTGSTITVPTGQTLTVTDGIPVASGGTGLASFAAGDLLYATGSTTLAKLAKGTAAQILQMNSGATAPEWVVKPAGGVVQTVSYATGAVHSMTNTSWANISGFTVTITPTSSSNKILLMASFGSVSGVSNNTTGYRFARGGTAIGIGDSVGSRDRGGWRAIGDSYSSGNHAYTAAAFYIDSPSTTSATTYTIQNECEGGTAWINRNTSGTDNADIYNAVYHSMLIAQEIV